MIYFLLLDFLGILKPFLFFLLRCLPVDALSKEEVLPHSGSRLNSFSVGESRTRLDILEDKFKLEHILSSSLSSSPSNKFNGRQDGFFDCTSESLC